MRGIIAEETDQYVVLNLGVGSTRIERERIAAIKHEKSARNEEIRQGWHKKYFLHHKYVAPALADLASGYSALLEQRDAAIRTKRSLDAAERTIQYERERIDSLQKQLAAVSRKLKGASPEDDIKKYNELVLESNALRADITLKHETVKEAEDRQKRVFGSISGYIAALAEFNAKFRKRQSASGAAGGNEKVLFERLEWKLAELNGELSQSVIPAVKKAGGIQVATLLNGNVHGTLILDTGASLVSISKDLANRLGVDTNGLPVQTMTLADGREVDGWSLILKSVRVGNACAKDVPAVILTGNRGATFDGLLGMSFLRNFAVHFDGATGNLILSSFTAE